MRYLVLALFLVGCGGSTGDVAPKPEAPEITGVQADAFECRLDGAACKCVIPEFSEQAIADMGTRCSFLRGVASDLY